LSMANGVATLAAILLGVLVYGAALLLTGSLTREELELVPRIGPRLAKLAERWKILR